MLPALLGSAIAEKSGSAVILAWLSQNLHSLFGLDSRRKGGAKCQYRKIMLVWHESQRSKCAVSLFFLVYLHDCCDSQVRDRQTTFCFLASMCNQRQREPRSHWANISLSGEHNTRPFQGILQIRMSGVEDLLPSEKHIDGTFNEDVSTCTVSRGCPVEVGGTFTFLANKVPWL